MYTLFTGRGTPKRLYIYVGSCCAGYVHTDFVNYPTLTAIYKQSPIDLNGKSTSLFKQCRFESCDTDKVFVNFMCRICLKKKKSLPHVEWPLSVGLIRVKIQQNYTDLCWIFYVRKINPVNILIQIQICILLASTFIFSVFLLNSWFIIILQYSALTPTPVYSIMHLSRHELYNVRHYIKYSKGNLWCWALFTSVPWLRFITKAMALDTNIALWTLLPL